MKALLISSLIVALLPMPVRGEAGNASTATQESLTRIRQAFPYDPAAKRETMQTREWEDPAVMMERLTVVGSYQHRQLQQKIESETREKQVEAFSLARGGALLRKEMGGARFEAGLFSTSSGWSLLRIRW